MTLPSFISLLSFEWDDPNFLFLGFAALLAVIASVQSVQEVLRRRRVANWPIAHGRIEVAGARHVPHFRTKWSWNEDPCQWTGILSYSYRVNGSTYPGTYKREFTYETEADDFMRGLADQPIPVSFNPANPAESVAFEADVDALLAAQHRSNDEAAPQQAFVSPLIGWVRILLWMLALVEGTAAAGVWLTYLIHYKARWELPEWYSPLANGAWVAAIISLVVWQVVQVQGGHYDYFWRAALVQCRRWGGILIGVILWNVLFNFLPFLNPFGGDSSSRWDGLMNGHWGTNGGFLMILYAGSATILWQVAEAGPRRCAGGHWVRRGNAICPACGAPVAR